MDYTAYDADNYYGISMHDELRLNVIGFPIAIDLVLTRWLDNTIFGVLYLGFL